MNLFRFVPGYDTHIYGGGRGPAFRIRGWGSTFVGGVHVHHLVPGIVMSLVLDEFAMLLHLDDVYWTIEGRLSIDASGASSSSRC